MILLGLQQYQSDKTKKKALKIASIVSGMCEGKLRAKLWSWIKYTSIQRAWSSDEDELDDWERSRPNIANDEVLMVGFIRACNDLMKQPGNLAPLASRFLVRTA